MFYITLTRDPDSGLQNTVHESKHSPTLDELQKMVGGLIEPAFTVDSPVGNDRCITAYVNEEGWCNNLPSFITINGQPVAGNMVILGLNDRTGESVLLDEDEVEWINSWIDKIIGRHPSKMFNHFRIMV